MMVSYSLTVRVEKLYSLFLIRWRLEKELSYSLLDLIILERFKLFLGILDLLEPIIEPLVFLGLSFLFKRLEFFFIWILVKWKLSFLFPITIEPSK